MILVCFLYFVTSVVLRTGNGPVRYRLINMEASAFRFNRNTLLEYVLVMIYLSLAAGWDRTAQLIDIMYFLSLGLEERSDGGLFLLHKEFNGVFISNCSIPWSSSSFLGIRCFAYHG